MCFQAGLLSITLEAVCGDRAHFIKKYCDIFNRASLVAQLAKPPAMQETQVQFLGQEDLLETG